MGNLFMSISEYHSADKDWLTFWKRHRELIQSTLPWCLYEIAHSTRGMSQMDFITYPSFPGNPNFPLHQVHGSISSLYRFRVKSLNDSRQKLTSRRTTFAERLKGRT